MFESQLGGLCSFRPQPMKKLEN